MRDVKIIPIEYGKSVLPEIMVFADGDAEKNCPIVFKIFLLQMSGKMVLVDAGCETMPGFSMCDFVGSVKALEEKGVKAEEITDVILTHAHHDHIECVKYFEKANIYLQKEEYEAAKPYLNENMKLILFNEYLELVPGISIVKIGGHSKGSCVVEIAEGEKTTVIAGDECYLRECLTRMCPTGASYCPERSKAFLQKYTKDNYRVLLCHDE